MTKTKDISYRGAYKMGLEKGKAEGVKIGEEQARRRILKASKLLCEELHKEFNFGVGIKDCNHDICFTKEFERRMKSKISDGKK